MAVSLHDGDSVRVVHIAIGRKTHFYYRKGEGTVQEQALRKLGMTRKAIVQLVNNPQWGKGHTVLVADAVRGKAKAKSMLQRHKGKLLGTAALSVAGVAGLLRARSKEKELVEERVEDLKAEVQARNKFLDSRETDLDKFEASLFAWQKNLARFSIDLHNTEKYLERRIKNKQQELLQEVILRIYAILKSDDQDHSILILAALNEYINKFNLPKLEQLPPPHPK